jgi:hypothetical protein
MNLRTVRLRDWVASKYSRIAVSQIVEDGVMRERRSEQNGCNTVMAAERTFYVLIQKQILSKVHKYKEVAFHFDSRLAKHMYEF